MRRQKIRGMDGSITVFLSLILTCICTLLGGLFASARTAGTGWYMQMALDSSLDSLMSKYHREVWEQYRIFMLEFEDEKGLAAEMEPYLESYFSYSPFYPVNNRELIVSRPVSVTEDGGRWFEKEILDYMRLGIWNVEKDPGVLKEMADGINEAESLTVIANQYKESGRQILKLEEIVEDIGECLERQKDYLEEGNRQLDKGSGSGFIRTAEKLNRELERIPVLVRQYEKKAEELQSEIAKAEKEAERYQADLQPQTMDLLSGEMDNYRSYIDREGSRHREVKQTEETANQNREILEEAVRKAGEIQEYIDSWEPDDEEDELDEDRLWRKVLTVTARFKTDSRFSATGKADKKKRKVLETLSRLAGSDLLSIVVPEGIEVSADRIDTSSFPSVTEMPPFSGSRQGLPGEERQETGLLELAYLHEYAAHFYTNFLSEGGTEREGRPVKYEQEYLLIGSGTDRENLKGTVNQIIAVREAMNLIYLLKDTEKRREAELMAATITGASGIAPLVSVTTFFILTVWAFAESVEDVKELLRGGKVPFIKQGAEWKISLSGMAESENGLLGEDASSGTKERGLNYQSYLKLLFLPAGRVEMHYRMMDMIQKNIVIGQPEFLMRKCAYRLEAECRGKGILIPVRKSVIKAY